jgi:hypothetical protein
MTALGIILVILGLIFIIILIPIRKTLRVEKNAIVWILFAVPLYESDKSIGFSKNARFLEVFATEKAAKAHTNTVFAKNILGNNEDFYITSVTIHS